MNDNSKVTAFSDEQIFSVFYKKQAKFNKLLGKQQETMLADWRNSEIDAGSKEGENSRIINELKLKLN